MLVALWSPRLRRGAKRCQQSAAVAVALAIVIFCFVAALGSVGALVDDHRASPAPTVRQVVIPPRMPSADDVPAKYRLLNVSAATAACPARFSMNYHETYIGTPRAWSGMIDSFPSSLEGLQDGLDMCVSSQYYLTPAVANDSEPTDHTSDVYATFRAARAASAPAQAAQAALFAADLTPTVVTGWLDEELIYLHPGCREWAPANTTFFWFFIAGTAPVPLADGNVALGTVPAGAKAAIFASGRDVLCTYAAGGAATPTPTPTPRPTPTPSPTPPERSPPPSPPPSSSGTSPSAGASADGGHDDASQRPPRRSRRGLAIGLGVGLTAAAVVAGVAVAARRRRTVGASRDGGGGGGAGSWDGGGSTGGSTFDGDGGDAGAPDDRDAGGGGGAGGPPTGAAADGDRVDAPAVVATDAPAGAAAACAAPAPPPPLPHVLAHPAGADGGWGVVGAAGGATASAGAGSGGGGATPTMFGSLSDALTVDGLFASAFLPTHPGGSGGGGTGGAGAAAAAPPSPASTLSDHMDVDGLVREALELPPAPL